MATQSCGNCKYFTKKIATAASGECSIFKSWKNDKHVKCMNYDKRLPSPEFVFNRQTSLL